MTTNQDRFSANFNANPPASSAEIREVELKAGLSLPEDYVAFLERANGGEGFIRGGYVILWRVEELVNFNTAYEVSEYAPGLFLFGSDGGGEAFAFDMRSNAKPIVCVPFVGMDLSLARPVAEDFASFLEL